MKTKSEASFEKYCAHRQYRYQRIELPVSAGPRSDYRLFLPAGEVVCEIKQIEPGPWEERIEDELRRCGSANASRAIGLRARALIRDAAPQLKAHKNEGVPLLLFAMDLTMQDHLSDLDVDAAMFGDPKFFFSIGDVPDYSCRPDTGHGGGRQMTETTRRYISAVCVMPREATSLLVFHNPFSIIPLMPNYFPHADDRHFFKGGHPEKSGLQWLEYVGGRNPPDA